MNLSTPSTAHFTAPDRLTLRVRRNESPLEARGPGELGVDIFLNGEPVRTYVTSVPALVHSVIEPGEHFFDTCSCGQPRCAGIEAGVLVRHEPGSVIWYPPPDFFGRGRQAGRRMHSVFRFERRAYRSAVIRCLQQLIDAGLERSADENPFAVWGDTVEQYRQLLAQIRASGKTKAVPSAQERLVQAVEQGDLHAMDCALADGADLLAGAPGETPWEQALSRRAVDGTAGRDFVLAVAEHLPVRARAQVRAHELQRTLDDSDADALYALGRLGGPWALSDSELGRCRGWVADRRLELEQHVAAGDEDASAGSGEGWRRLFELDLLDQVLDRIAAERTSGSGT